MHTQESPTQKKSRKGSELGRMRSLHSPPPTDGWRVLTQDTSSGVFHLSTICSAGLRTDATVRSNLELRPAGSAYIPDRLWNGWNKDDDDKNQHLSDIFRTTRACVRVFWYVCMLGLCHETLLQLLVFFVSPFIPTNAINEAETL